MSAFRDLPYSWKDVVVVLSAMLFFANVGGLLLQACDDCDKKHGVLVKNAWGWVTCVDAK